MNDRYQLPERAFGDDPLIAEVRIWCEQEGITPNLVPVGARISYNPKLGTASFFGFVRTANDRLIIERHGRHPKKRRMTFKVSTPPPAELVVR